jgi:hypothetical protein
MYVSFFAVALNLLLNWIFTRQLGWGHRGLAFSTGCVATCNFIVLYLLMHRHLHRLETRRLATLVFKVALACAALLSEGPRRTSELKATIPDAPKTLLRNVYGWFARVERGRNALTQEGMTALGRWP